MEDVFSFGRMLTIDRVIACSVSWIFIIKLYYLIVSTSRSLALRYSRRTRVSLHNYCTVCLVTHDPAEEDGGEREGQKGRRDTGAQRPARQNGFSS